MKKEQTLLVVAVGVAGLLVWSSTGLYASVRPAEVGAGTDLATTSVAATSLEPVGTQPTDGGRLLRETRTEHRKARPELDLPPSIGYPWVRPLPWPELPPSFWGLVRDPMTRVAKPAAPEDAAKPADPAAEEPEETPEEQAARIAAADKAKAQKEAQERLANAAQVILPDGKSIPARLTPIEADAGQPVWVILEKWGGGANTKFYVEELNRTDGRSVVGKYPADATRFQTVHLEKTLINEYHEERIRSGVRPGDRQKNIEFAGWIRSELAKRYGVPALRLALEHLNAAKAVAGDAQLVLLTGDTAREAFDLDAEIRAYTEYLQGPRATETSVIVPLGDAYERAGALPAAREQFEKAAKLGDTEGRLRLGNVLIALAEQPSELDAAYDVLKDATGAQPAQKARALAGMARIRLRQGNLAEAVRLASEARTADVGSFEANVVHGVAQYASGKFLEAEQAFAAAATLERGGGTRARSNRAMAMLAQDKLPEAVAEADACIAADALNFFDPLLVQGEAQQRWGELDKSNNTFLTALQRHPRNPWILLRLASIRMRDGLPEQALLALRGGDGVTGLLQIAPESVDALHVAGLAMAAQATPDWDSAVKYLRRAHEKDLRNLDVVYDLGKVLHLAGRTDEAIAFLERVTESNQGIARNDARVLAVFGWIAFDGGRPVDQVFDVLNRARRAQQSPWTKEYVDRVYEEVVRWDKTRIWLDDFNRVGQEVRNNWVETESLGIGVGLDQGSLLMAGRAKTAPDRARYTGIVRDEDLQLLNEVEVVLRAAPNFEFVVHLYSGELPAADAGGAPAPGRRPARSTASELGFGRDRNGAMKLWIYSGGGKLFNVPVKDAQGADRNWPDDGQPHRVVFRRTGPAQKGEFEIWLDDEKIATPEPIEIGGLAAQTSRQAKLGVHVDADEGTQVDLKVDSIQIEKILKNR